MNITLSQFLFLFFISTGYSRKRINFDKTRSLSRSDWSPNLVSSNDLFAPQNNLSFSASIFLSLVLLFRSFGSKCRKFYIFLNHTLDTASENFLPTRIHAPIQNVYKVECIEKKSGRTFAIFKIGRTITCAKCPDKAFPETVYRKKSSVTIKMS